MRTKKNLLSAAFVLGFGVLTAQTPISLQQLQTATNKPGTEGGKARQVGVTNAQGKQRYVAFPDVLVTPITYTPPTTGNTINLSRFVERHDSVWYIDHEGDAKLLTRGSGGGGSPDADWLTVRHNAVPYVMGDTIWHDNIASINGRNYFADVELNVYDSTSTAGATVAAIGNRGGRFAAYNTITGAWSSYGQEGSVAEIFAGAGATNFSITKTTGTAPGSPAGTFDEHLNIDLTAGNIKFNKYPNTRDDSGTVVNFLGTDAVGKVVSNPISELPSGGSTWNYQKAAAVTGGTIAVTVPIPSSGTENTKIVLYREGVKMRFGDDFTVSGSNFILTVAASSETFEIFTQ